MLGSLVRGLHFNTYSSEDAIKRLHGWASHLEKGQGVMTASFDITNMFAELPHAAILESLEWMIRMMEAKGFDRVNVNCRGKKLAMGKQNRDGHFPVKFDRIRKWVRYELEFSYSLAEGELIQQIQGIPMGGHTSPSLACILCVRSEAQFMYELGTLRKRILGLRLMDDVAVFVRFVQEKTESACQARDILEKLKGCYPSSLSLERTHADDGTPSFLGCRILVDQEGPKITSVLQMKNQDCMSGDQPLTFQCIQDFRSYSDKQTKTSMIKSYLHLIVRCSNDAALRDLPVACLRKELRTRHFPVPVIEKVVQSFECDQRVRLGREPSIHEGWR
ncbi:hypothetical protein CBR_g37576 [Chara braunii]|nr:hypothetical protein CBR_g37576 [Chara braunii]|eukprot:GBG83776.1 hypothetical protein CBR_g37576 [Chara braunii]